MPRCRGRSKTGQRCKASATSGNFCESHKPSIIQQPNQQITQLPNQDQGTIKNFSVIYSESHPLTFEFRDPNQTIEDWWKEQGELQVIKYLTSQHVPIAEDTFEALTVLFHERGVSFLPTAKLQLLISSDDVAMIFVLRGQAYPLIAAAFAQQVADASLRRERVGEGEGERESPREKEGEEVEKEREEGGKEEGVEEMDKTDKAEMVEDREEIEREKIVHSKGKKKRQDKAKEPKINQERIKKAEKEESIIDNFQQEIDTLPAHMQQLAQLFEKKLREERELLQEKLQAQQKEMVRQVEKVVKEMVSQLEIAAQGIQGEMKKEVEKEVSGQLLKMKQEIKGKLLEAADKFSS